MFGLWSVGKQCAQIHKVPVLLSSGDVVQCQPRCIRDLAVRVTAEGKVDQHRTPHVIEQHVVKANVAMVQTNVVHGLQCEQNLITGVTAHTRGALS